MIVRSPCLCNVISFIGLFQNITKFVIVGYGQLKLLKKSSRFKVFNSHETQNTEATTQTCFTEIAV